MPRPRNKNNVGLPARWRFKHGAYRYQVPPGLEHQWDGRREFTLGATLAEAYKAWAERVQRTDRAATTVAALLDRYLLEVVPQKARATQVSDRKKLPKVARAFGHARLDGDLEPHHIYEYVSKNTHRLTAAHREVELLSHALTMAVQWGLIKAHPFKGQVRFERTLALKPSERYVEDWEVLEVLSLQPRRPNGSVLMVQAYIRLKLLTGLRQTDLLLLKPATFTDVGIPVETSKTSARQVFTWTPELRAAVDMALSARPLDIAPWLFCTKDGGCYVNADNEVRTFARIWNNFMHRALNETKLTARFKERDLRAKVASDADSLERARELLGHADARLTKKVYIRKPAAVRPAKGVAHE